MKKITAIILVFAMLIGIGAVSVSAAQIGDTIRWDYRGDSTAIYIYELDGHLKLGENTIPPVIDDEWNDDFDVVYEFEVEKAGCYLIDHRDTDRDDNDGLKIAEIYENGYACGFEEGSLPDDDGELIYWLDKGTALFGINVKEEGSTVSIKPYDGERPSLTYDVDNYIESVEIENFEYYTTSYERFNGTYSFANPMEDGAKITVNFKNGTSAAVERENREYGPYYTIFVPIGDESYFYYPVCVYQYVDAETSKVYFVLSIDEYEMIKEECTIIKKDFAVNFDYLATCLEATSWTIVSTFNEIITMLKNNDFETLSGNAGAFGSDFSWWFKTTVKYIFMFSKYFVL